MIIELALAIILAFLAISFLLFLAKIIIDTMGPILAPIVLGGFSIFLKDIKF